MISQSLELNQLPNTLLTTYDNLLPATFFSNLPFVDSKLHKNDQVSTKNPTELALHCEPCKFRRQIKPFALSEAMPFALLQNRATYFSNFPFVDSKLHKNDQVLMRNTAELSPHSEPYKFRRQIKPFALSEAMPIALLQNRATYFSNFPFVDSKLHKNDQLSMRNTAELSPHCEPCAIRRQFKPFALSEAMHIAQLQNRAAFY